MTTSLKIGGFLAALAALFGLAVLAGDLAGPTAEPVASHDENHTDTGHEAHPSDDRSDGAGDLPGGLMVSQSGYTMRLTSAEAASGRDVPVAFAITGPDGQPVTSYEVEHEKRLHLIAVRRDYSGFQHVHPRLREGGRWYTQLDLTPGSWRLFADFRATGAPGLTLGTDLSVSGRYDGQPVTGESRVAHVDGYTVTLDGTLTPGSDAKLTATVTRNGRPVTDLQPYLGAYGHLVALREGDLAYLHVHPEGSPGDGTTEAGPAVVFYAAVPSRGTYRLYLDFQHEGVVRTAAFTVSTQGTSAPQAPDGPTHSDDGDGHGH